MSMKCILEKYEKRDSVHKGVLSVQQRKKVHVNMNSESQPGLAGRQTRPMLPSVHSLWFGD